MKTKRYIGIAAAMAMLACALPLRADDKEEVRKLVDQANNDSWADKRMLAAQKLKDHGAAGIDGLIELLDAKESSMARFAGQQLAALGAPAAPKLAQALKAGSPRAKMQAAVALAQLGELGRPALVEGSKSENAETRQSATEGLRELGQASRNNTEIVKAQVAALAEKDVQLRDKAAQDLMDLSSRDATALDAVLKQLKSGTREARLSLAVATGTARVEISPKLIPSLFAAFEDPDPRIREQFSDVLRARPWRMPDIRQYVEKALGSRYPEIRIAALRIYMDKSEDALPSRSRFKIMARNDPNPEVRQVAAAVVERADSYRSGHPTLGLGPQPKSDPQLADDVKKLQKALTPSHTSAELIEACSMAKRMGVDAVQAGPALVALLGNPDEQVATAADIAIQSLRASAALCLIEGMRSKNQAVRLHSQSLFQGCEVEMNEQTPLLLKSLKDPEPMVRANVAKALGFSTSKESPGALAAILGDKDVTVRAAAAEALSGRQTLPGAVVPALTKALSDADPHVRATAARALSNAGAAALPAVTALEKLAHDDPDASVRSAATESARAINLLKPEKTSPG